MQLRLNEYEFREIEEKFRNSGLKSKSEFIRVMVLEGLMIYIDEKTTKDIYRAVSSVSNNVNQIARRVNSTGNVYAEDIAEIKNGVSEIWQQLRSFRSQLQSIKPSPILQTPKRQTADD
ncbi:MAG: plasmid mobilization relaxosome protein MobC [Ruminococcus sp.]|nr:plasmid mobilization relaxosome protein MobC [Ruminococcus sp.]